MLSLCNYSECLEPVVRWPIKVIQLKNVRENKGGKSTVKCQYSGHTRVYSASYSGEVIDLGN